MLIEKNKSLRNSLFGKTILLTGAGGGIGTEAAKAFAYMGAHVIAAEIDPISGSAIEKQITESGGSAEYYRIDLTDTAQIREMTEYIRRKYGCPDVVFNNAAAAKIGAVDEVDIAFWDKSYAVNLRAPLLLTQAFLPEMKKRDSGALVFVSSSGASPDMGAYEVFKTSQVELANTLAMEIEDTHVHAFTIGPGLVKTKTAMDAIVSVAARMGMSLDEFYDMNRQHILDAESAGTGFALSVLHAALYRGQEIGSIQVLMDFGLSEPDALSERPELAPGVNAAAEIKEYMQKILDTYEEQYRGWQNMNVFERQWVLRDLKKSMGMPAGQVQDKLRQINTAVHSSSFRSLTEAGDFLVLLRKYWERQLKLLNGYEKNRQKLEENTRIISGWIADISRILALSLKSA